MLSVSPSALRYLSELLANAGAPADEGIRLVTGGGDWDVQRDMPSPDDVVYSHEGRVVLLLTRQAAESMGGLQLNLDENEAGLELNDKNKVPDK
jgi:hypothetical protein